MKRTITSALSLLLIAAMLVSLTACGASGKVKRTIEEFQKACNNQDVNALIDCLDPSIASLLKIGAGFLGSFTGLNASEVFSTLSGLLQTGTDTFGIDSFKTLKIKVKNIAVEDTKAEAKVTFTYMGSSDTEKTTDATISLKLSDEKWLISGVKFH